MVKCARLTSKKGTIMASVQTTRMSSKGQVVIPEAMRNQFGWEVGTSFIVEVYQGNLIMQPIEPTPQSEFAKRFDALLKQSRAQARAAGLRPVDLTDVISDYRRSRQQAKA